jgi:phospholipid/cholesterol/gamma-HCH transport system substrate-binding protein
VRAEEVKPFSERNPVAVGAVSMLVIAGIVWMSLNYNKIPFIGGGRGYSAYFAEAGGLAAGNPVEVSGAKVGQVSSVALDGARVIVNFKIDKDIHIGDQSEAAIKVKTLLGSKYLEVTPRGEGQQTSAIPLDRTKSPYQLPDALGDLATTIGGLNTDQLSNSLAVLANEFSNTPPDLKDAVQGLGRFSKSLNDRDAQLRTLLDNANKATKVLADRSDEVVNLVVNTNALLVELETQSGALDQMFGNLSALARQIKGFIAENRATLKPALEKLNGVLAIVDNRKEKVQEAIKGLNGYALSLGESVSSGPIFKAIVGNLLPGQFIQPFIDAAFSDLGLDPATQLPSALTDPQTGQPGTPALPIPYPRTGQGGEPRLTLPDAITGKPGDQGCGPPGLPLPGPTGCYPLREEPPAPPPGGPPPGPPAQTPPISEQPLPPGGITQTPPGSDPLTPVPAVPPGSSQPAQESGQ